MPELARVLAEEDLKRGALGSHVDLAPYLAIVDEVASGGVGGLLALEDGESQRAAKRRMSLAAKERGYELTWRKSGTGELRFVLARPGEMRPGGRQRRAPSSGNAASAGGRRGQPAKRGRS